ncbi:MAG: YlbF family regulator [Firmicutes bacterium]|nr:YlbF family regulator [Candidatus Fiminaster equi]
MTNLDELISSINDELKQEECVKQYFYYKNLVENDDTLKQLDKDVRFHQKEMCKNKNNPEVYAKEKALYEELKNKFDNNPVLINYQIAKDEVYSILVDIKNVLS